MKPTKATNTTNSSIAAGHSIVRESLRPGSRGITYPIREDRTQAKQGEQASGNENYESSEQATKATKS